MYYFEEKNNQQIDELFVPAVDITFELGQASVSMIQRRLKLGYARATRLIDDMERYGIIGPFEGIHPRKINISEEEWEKLKNSILNGEGVSCAESRGVSMKVETHSSGPYDFDAMTGYEFEHYCSVLLEKSGFSNVKVTPASGDQGADILAEKDGIKYAVQCKNYSNPLGNTPVQEVSAARLFYNCHVGVVLTNSTFTPGAIALARATNVLLWDKKKLLELIENADGIEVYSLNDELSNSSCENSPEIWNIEDENAVVVDADLSGIGSTSVTKSMETRKGMKILAIMNCTPFVRQV